MGVLPDGRAVTALQSALIEAPPGAAVPGLRVAARYAAAEAAQVGGDWYDTAPLPDGKVLIAVGDVSGHGLLAAAGMSQLRHALRGMAYTGAEPAQILTWLNQMICHQRPGYVATAICARYNPANRTLTWARAGHLPPLLVRAGDVTALPPPEGIVLGAVADASYAASVVHLEPRDFELMFTDGLVERRGDELGHGWGLSSGTTPARMCRSASTRSCGGCALPTRRTTPASSVSRSTEPRCPGDGTCTQPEWIRPAADSPVPLG